MAIFQGNLPEPKETFTVFLDSGLQTQFFPLYRPDTTIIREDDPEDLRKAAERAERNFGLVPEDRRADLLEVFGKSDYEEQDASWGSFRFGSKTWTLPNGNLKVLYGIWISIETNTSDGMGNSSVGGPRYDRGSFYQRLALSEQEKQQVIQEYMSGQYRGGRKVIGGEVHYLPNHDGECLKLRIFHPKVNLGELKFELVILKPAAEPHDVDVVLDLGNTRTAGLLFDHMSDVRRENGMVQRDVFPPAAFRQKFKVLRLKPDPHSGEYDSMDDVSAGIADSWMVLHELDHQKFMQKDSDKRPRLLQREVVAEGIDVQTTGLIFKKTHYEVKGCVVERIPQMFSTSSPVLLGDAAYRQFDFPYTRMLVGMGLKLQQSSPKRFYWDDQESRKDWCMILNEWDPSRDDDPRDDPFAPVLQSEMLRYTRDDGHIVDLSRDLEPSERPTPFREHPRFPRQSTLTWFLLHVLERADSQCNHTFRGQDFEPSRLRRVLMTYPSGWTPQEVDEYRARCQEALDIFSETHLYHGVKNELRLEMVPREMCPDEAVAGQLPFVFSEILRYKGQTATDWIKTTGKSRRGADGVDRSTVRIMNFDIGGGTTDISVIEYENLNRSAGIAANRLSTRLLFRDGQARAGDDLLKLIVEKLILDPLIEQSQMVRVPDKKDQTFADIVYSKFSQPAKSEEETAVRSRIVRTCLIPLATYCLAHADKSEYFSAMDAGVNENNWKEFVFQFLLGKDSELDCSGPSPLPREAKKFRTDSQVLNGLIRKTFGDLIRNCAMYLAAYDVDLLVFSGKTSELSYIREMAELEIPLPSTRMIFARSFKPGDWYPFTDANGYIRDAKTVTVVGAALYYALANGFITNWSIRSEPATAFNVNEWGELEAMRNVIVERQNVFLPSDPEVEVSEVIDLMPNCILARRQNICSTPEPVYKLLCQSQTANDVVTCRLKRVRSEAGESLELLEPESDTPLQGCELKLWPSSESLDGVFWQESGLFVNIRSGK